VRAEVEDTRGAAISMLPDSATVSAAFHPLLSSMPPASLALLEALPVQKRQAALPLPGSRTGLHPAHHPPPRATRRNGAAGAVLACTRAASKVARPGGLASRQTGHQAGTASKYIGM
jgi:hypothetical protein